MKNRRMKHVIQIKYFLVIMLFSGLLFNGSLYASHSMGADLTYECLGGNTYRITISFYRDCFGAPAPANPTVTINSTSCGQSLSIDCTPIPGTGQEVTPACSSSVTTCNGGTYTGIQEWIYQGTVTLPAQCNDWVFGLALCCRNAAITTISTPNTNTFYISATLNNTVTPCNSSPTFSNKPVPFLCRGQQFCFNHGAYDPDGDSLVYSLVTPRQTASTFVNYLSPYNASNPLNSVPAATFNTVTGDICLTPQNIEVTVTAVLVEEYRNGVLIGSVERDLQLTVMNCANNLPSLTGINGTNNFSATLCANQANCFNILSSDPDAGQNLSVTWNSSIPGATFTSAGGNNPTATFCWTPNNSNIGHTYSFTASVTDDACPYNGSQTYSYQVTVNGISVSLGPDVAVPCGGVTTLTASTTGNPASYTYLWNTGATTQSISAGPGVYWVTLSDGSCTATDTIAAIAPIVPIAAYSSQANGCANSTISFTDFSTTTSGTITSWSWNFGNGGTSTVRNPNYIFTTPGIYDVRLIVTNSAGCVDTIIEPITIDTTPAADFSPTSVCVNSASAFTDLSTGSTVSWDWTFGDGSTSTIQNPSHAYTTSGNFTATLIVGNAFGCFDTITHTVSVHANPTANAGSDRYTCLGNSTTLIANGGQSYTWMPGSLSGQSVSVSPASTTNYTVTVTDIFGCSATDVVNVLINPLPNVNAIANQSICAGSSVTLTVTGANLYSWSPGGNTTSSITVSPSVTTTYTVTGTNANTCSNTDVVTVTVNSAPAILTGTDQNICLGGSTSLSASGASTYHWSPGNASFSSITVSPVLNTTYTVTGTSALGCTSTEDIIVYVNPNPTVNLNNSFTCKGTAATLDAGNPGSTYSWSAGQTTQTISVLDSGNYSVTVTTNAGCQASDSAYVTVGFIPNTNPVDYTVCQGQSVMLNAMHQGNTFHWSNGQTTQTINVTNPGTYIVTITDANGCTASMNHKLKVNNVPIAAFTSLPSCLGSAASFINNTNGNNTIIQSTSWNFGDGTTSALSSPSHIYASSGNYQVTLTVTTDNGCTSSVTNQVTVNPLPAASYTSTPTCRNLAVSLNNTSTISSGTIASWNWDFGDGTTSTSMSPSHLFSTPGIKNVILIAASNKGCTDTVNEQVIIIDIPTASFSASNTCQESAVNFTNNSTGNGSPLNTYLWNLGNGTTSNTQQPVYQYSNAGTYNVMLVVTDANGCKDTASLPLIIYSQPSASFTAAAVCDGNAVNIINTSTSTSGAIQNYDWNLGDNSTSSNIQPSHVYPSTGQYVITLITTTVNGCKDTTSKNVSIRPLAVPNFTSANVCFGNSMYFADSSIISSGSISASLWNFGDGNTSNLISPTHNYNAPGSYNVSLTITSNMGCESQVIKNVTVYPNPVVSFAASNVCSGSNTQFVNQSIISNGEPLTYSWSFGDGESDNIKDPVHQYLNTGSFNAQLIVTSSHGCSAAASDSLYVFENPIARFVAPGNCSGAPVLFSNQSSSVDGNIVTYLWTFGDGGYSYELSPQHIYTDSGSYNVDLMTISSHGCSGRYADSVSVFPHPMVSIQMNNACEGSPVTMTANSNISSGVTYSWTIGSSVLSTASSFNHTFNQPGSYNISLAVTSNLGCGGLSNNQLTIFPKPVVSFTANNVCQNSPVVFSNHSAVSSGTISTYSWNFGDSNHSGSSNPAHTYSWPGSFNTVLTAISNQGCSSTYSNQVDVHPNPIVVFAAGAQGCSPVIAGFTESSSVSTGSISTYLWNFGDGKVSTDQHPIHTYNQAGLYDVTLNVVTNFGCQASSTQTDIIKVNPNPTADFTADPMIVDANMPLVNFQNQSQGYQSFQWNFGDGSNTSTEFSPSHMFSDTGTYSAMLITVNNFGCRDSVYKTIEVKLYSTLFAPNCFTPNGDGINDSFQPVHTNMKDLQVWIFDRWGKLLTNWDGLDGSWDGYYLGRKCQQDTYVYKIVGKGQDGKNSEWVGHVSIVN